jgi:general secretion pathway protein I
VTRAARGRGFMLLEVMLAVLFLALALGAGIFSTGRFAANAAVLREKTVALWVAHNRLTEIGLEPAWPSVGKSDGEVTMAGVDWRWEVEVVETPDPRVRRVNIAVRPKSAESDSARLSSFLEERKP